MIAPARRSIIPETRFVLWRCTKSPPSRSELEKTEQCCGVRSANASRWTPYKLQARIPQACAQPLPARRHQQRSRHVLRGHAPAAPNAAASGRPLPPSRIFSPTPRLASSGRATGGAGTGTSGPRSCCRIRISRPCWKPPTRVRATLPSSQDGRLGRPSGKSASSSNATPSAGLFC